jgi:hypothetical protein
MNIQNNLVPIVIEQSSRGERSYDIFPACFEIVLFS